MKISVCCPSYTRPKGLDTPKYLPFIRVYVDEREAEAYTKNNPQAIIVPVKSKYQGNLCRIRNFILKNEFDQGADVVLIVDDDLKGIYFWEQKKKNIVTGDEFLWFIEKYSIIAKEWGVFFWGINVNQDKQVYREYTPFSTTSYIGGPFQCFLKGNDCEYDENLPLKEDYDMTLQQLNKHRKVLRVNKFFYDVKQSEQAGGCATYRNMDREKQQLQALQKKWGTKIVRVDRNLRSHNIKKVKRQIDYNPIISVPIKGV
jgi:hypothetical protein